MCAAVIMDGTVVTLLRPDDMLVLDLRFVNLRRTEDEGGATVLMPADAAAPAFIEVTFPPQAVIEALGVEFVFSGTFGESDARFSGPSRLTFGVPRGTSIRFTADGLLAWADLVALPDRSDVECAWDIVFRPSAPDATWAHAATPVVSAAGVAELWHTRLTAGDDTGPTGIGSRRPVPLGVARAGAFEPPFDGSLTDGQRVEVARSAAVRPVLARELTLSALGATIDLVGDWADVPQQLTLVGYRHRAVFGREDSVDTVQRGYLLPFGIPVQITEHTERVLSNVAPLVRVAHLTVLDPEVRYDEAVGVPFEGRDFPFRRIHLTGPLRAEVSTANEIAPGFPWVDTPSGDRMFFAFTAEDWEGHTASFSEPAVFVGRSQALGDLDQVVGLYDDERKAAPAPAAGRVSLAPSVGGSQTAVDVTAVYIGARVADADAATLGAAGQLAVFPRLVGVDAHIPVLDAFGPRVRTGVAAATTLHLDEEYVRSGLRGPGIYASLKQQVAFAPPVTSAGGLAALSLPVSGLSRTAGLVGGDLDAFRQGAFDPATYFKAAQGSLEGLLPPKLLGFLKLADLVQKADAGDGEAVPRIVTAVHPEGDRTTPPEEVRSTVTWRPRLKEGLHAALLRTTADTTLDLRSTTVVRLDGGAPIADVRGELRSFDLEFAGGVLVLDFERLAFTSRSGAPPALDVKVADVRFGGHLRFLEALRPYLPSPRNGPRTAVTAAGLEASHTLAIPALSIGVFMLQNLALSASVTLPLDGTPVRARFAVSSRDDPFLVTVSLFGGGGFIELEVVSDRIHELQAQIEFGAATSLDLGIASASVAVTAGVYIKLSDDVPQLTGFLRAVGELDVLGLVTVSVELYLGLGYDEVPKNPAIPNGPTRPVARGAAMVSVRVRVLFFSESVTLTVTRSFGGGIDPAFDAAFPTPEPWRQRCAAFAPMVRS